MRSKIGAKAWTKKGKKARKIAYLSVRPLGASEAAAVKGGGIEGESRDAKLK